MITRATRGDCEAIANIEKRCFSSPLPKAFIEQDITGNVLSCYLVYKKDDEVVGYIGLWLSDPAQIINLAVIPEYQKQGIGKALIAFVLEILRGEGIMSITLDVRRSNSSALALYEGFNFNVIASRPRYYDNGEDALVMELIL